MNTKASVVYGWGVLIAAGGGAYYFAKRSINADRQERLDMDERRRQAMHKIQYGIPAPKKQGDSHASPGKDAHEGEVSPAGVREPQSKSKYEASQPYRATKGDRFS